MRKKILILTIILVLMIIVTILYHTKSIDIVLNKKKSQTEQLKNDSKNITNELILVKGGTFKNKNSNFYGKKIVVQDFYISKYEITQKEWIDVMGYNPSKFKGDNLPVEMVSWYEAIEYCNKRSLKEGLDPYYNIYKDKKDPDNRCDMDDIKWTVTINPEANGYRLPTEIEWEYAASGGKKSKNYIYSGSSNVDEVAWYWRNSGNEYLNGFWYWPIIENNNNKTKPVGLKKPNELGIYDMSGNVREWCWDWYKMNIECKSCKGGTARVWRGGGWIGAEFCCKISYRGSLEPNGKGPDTGFRVCRNK